MTEQLFIRGLKRIKHLAACSKVFDPGTGVFLVVALVLCARGFQGFHSRGAPKSRDGIAGALGSPITFYGTPYVSDGGSEIMYFRSSEKGIGLFKSNLANGQRQTVFEKPVTEWLDCISPLSSNRALVAWSYNTINLGGYISIYSADSGAEAARVEASGWHVSTIAWMGPEKMVCRGWSPEGTKFHLIQKQADGTWQAWDPGVIASNSLGLAALSKDTFCWADSRGIQAFNVVGNTTNILFNPEGRKISEFSYFEEGERLLVTCKEKSQDSLWQVELDEGNLGASNLITSDKSIQNAHFINRGGGYAYVNGHMLVVKASSNSLPVKFDYAAVNRLVAAPSAQNICFIGTISNEPSAGLWKYDAVNESFSELASWSEHPLAHSARSDPSFCAIHLASNRWIYYYVYWPSNFDRREKKKYPLVIGDTPLRPIWAQAIAACGAYVVVVDRSGWFNGFDKVGSDIENVLDELVRDQTIDRKDAFLFGTSAETTPISRLVEEKPDLWRGVLLLNAGELPDLRKLGLSKRMPKIYIDAGVEEGLLEGFQRYQEQAAALGIEVEIQQIPDVGHFLYSTSSLEWRARRMASFIFD